MLNQIIKLNGEIWAQEMADAYVENRGIKNIIGCERSNVYDDYLEFCKEKNITPLTTNQLMFRINKKHGTTTKVIKLEKKCIRVIVKKEADYAQSKDTISSI